MGPAGHLLQSASAKKYVTFGYTRSGTQLIITVITRIIYNHFEGQSNPPARQLKSNDW